MIQPRCLHITSGDLDEVQRLCEVSRRLQMCRRGETLDGGFPGLSRLGEALCCTDPGRDGLLGLPADLQQGGDVSFGARATRRVADVAAASRDDTPQPQGLVGISRQLYARGQEVECFGPVFIARVVVPCFERGSQSLLGLLVGMHRRKAARRLL